MKAQIIQAGDKITATITNTLLFTFYLYGTTLGKYGSSGVHKAFQEARELLDDFNYETIKHALSKLKSGGLITRSKKRTHLEIAITNEGKKRIAQMFPHYQDNRSWDGHVYLISYDIPTKANKARDLLREYIRDTGGAILQESLWMNPYDPQTILEEFINERNISGTILISKLGTDGAIGTERLSDLISRIYNYDKLTKRYLAFLQKYTTYKNPPIIAVTIAYFEILRDDPQLPFPLEPKNFPGKEAHALFESLRNRFINANK